MWKLKGNKQTKNSGIVKWKKKIEEGEWYL